MESLLTAFRTVHGTTFLGFALGSALILFFSYHFREKFGRALVPFFRSGLYFLAFTNALFAFSLQIPVFWEILLAVALLFAANKIRNAEEVRQLQAADALSLPLLGIFTVIFASFYIGPLDGHLYSPDWSKNRSVLYSLLEDPFAPDLRGFGDHFHATLVYYYAPFHLPALIAGAIQKLLHLPVLTTLKVCFALVVIQSIWLSAWALCFLPLFFKRFFGTYAVQKQHHIFFLMFFTLWAGGDFWWRLAEIAPEFAFGDHHDGVFHWTMQAQVHAVTSLMIWVPSQLAGSLCALAIVAPLRRGSPVVRWAYALSFAVILGASAVSAAGILILLLLWLFLQNGKKLRFQIADYLPVILIFMVFYLFYSQKQYRDGFHFLIQSSQDIGLFLRQFLREYAFVFWIIALAYWKNILNRKILVVMSLMLLASFTLYYGIYNAWALKAMIPITIALSYFATAIHSKLQKRLQITTFAIFLAFAAPLVVNEWIYALRSESAVFEDRAGIIQPYVGRPKPAPLQLFPLERNSPTESP